MSEDIFEQIGSMGHEDVVLCADDSIGYRGIIAIHSTRLGPAVGGTRYWQYDSDRAALADALRLSRGMSYKNSVAGLPFGGGKSVILAQPGANREAVFTAHGRAIERIGGRYVTAEDVGTTVSDMEIMHRQTRYVAGLKDGAGDPSPYTALGVFRAMQACAEFAWGSDSLKDKSVAVQGVGGVGGHLVRLLAEDGARITICDVNRERAESIALETGALVVDPMEIYSAGKDVFAPCALGAILNDATIPRLNARVVVGGANNQLLEPRHADDLERRGIVYGPDYVANAGGVISGSMDIAKWTREQALDRIDAIRTTMLRILESAKQNNVSTAVAADRLAEERLLA